MAVAQLFVGDGWLLTLGLMFMLEVIFLPGGLVEGRQRIAWLSQKRNTPDAADPEHHPTTSHSPGE